MPTTYNVYFSNKVLTPAFDADLARVRNVNIAASQTIAAGTILGEVTASPGTFIAYASGNVDGSAVAKGIALYDLTTDAYGNISLGTTANPGTPIADGINQLTTPIYVSGSFLVSDLTGLDATAVSTLVGRFENGSISGGTFRF